MIQSKGPFFMVLVYLPSLTAVLLSENTFVLNFNTFCARTHAFYDFLFFDLNANCNSIISTRFSHLTFEKVLNSFEHGNSYI